MFGPFGWCHSALSKMNSSTMLAQSFVAIHHLATITSFIAWATACLLIMTVRLNILYVRKLHWHCWLQSGDGIADPDWFGAEEIFWHCHFVQSRRRHLRWGGGRHVADYDWVAHLSDGTRRARVERRRGCERASSSNVQVQIVSLCGEACSGERKRHKPVKHVKFILFEIFFRAEAAINDALKRKAEVLREHCVNERIDAENTGNAFLVSCDGPSARLNRFHLRRIAITQPEQNGKQNLVDAIVTKGTNKEQRDERQPAEYKHSCMRSTESRVGEWVKSWM